LFSLQTSWSVIMHDDWFFVQRNSCSCESNYKPTAVHLFSTFTEAKKQSLGQKPYLGYCSPHILFFIRSLLIESFNLRLYLPSVFFSKFWNNFLFSTRPLYLCLSLDNSKQYGLSFLQYFSTFHC
jgi:hypothetical protein